MIYIKKKAEPASLRKHRGTPGADFDGLDKKELRESLLEEQGYLCAYCMKRIRSNKDVKIEHYEARNSENQLRYGNLLAVCVGNASSGGNERRNPDRFTCDTRKGKQVLHINPQNRADMETIFYDNQGRIYSRNKRYQEDLDEILNLNDKNGYLIQNRRAALRPLIRKLSGLKEGQDAVLLLRKLEAYCFNMDEKGEYPEYAGILQWYVKRHLQKHL